MTAKFSTSVRNAMGDAITADIGSAGILRIYDGTRPANVTAAITGTLLAELTMGSPFAPATSGGVITPNAITQDSSANATGTATHYRMFRSNGTTACEDGDVSATGGGGDLQLNTVSIVAGGPVVVTAFTHTLPGA